jgi:hypothetical protein
MPACPTPHDPHASDIPPRFDNEHDRSPQAEKMYVDELREVRAFLHERTTVPELKALNLLGVQFATCEARARCVRLCLLPCTVLVGGGVHADRGQ